MSECQCECKPINICLPQYKVYPIASFGDLKHEYYSSHFNVDTVDQLYHLPLACEENTMHILRLTSTAGGRVLIDVDHLSGNHNQVQLNMTGAFVKMLYRCCAWHVIDGVSFQVV